MKTGELNRETLDPKELVDVNQLILNVRELAVLHERSPVLLANIERDIAKIRRSDPSWNESKVTLEYCRRHIGDRVRIVNPKRGEPNIGTIVAVGKLYISVQLTPELVRYRQAKNLRLIEDEA